MFRIKPHTRQRCSEGSNKPCVHQDPETPQRPRQNCVWMSPEEVHILECEVKWAIGSITMNKASGGDGIPVELFQS